MLFRRLLFICVMVLFMPVVGIAQVPAEAQIVNYQGSLLDNGAPVNGVKKIVFKIYDAQTGGTSLWESGEKPLNVVDGLYTYKLGSGATPFGAMDWGTGAKWLEVTIVQSPNMVLPRSQIVAVPYAMNSQNSLNSVNAQNAVNANECSAIVGMIATFPGQKSGWLICDGKTVHPTDISADYHGAQYQVLYDYLIGLNNNNFKSGVLAKLPDLRGEFVRGIDDRTIANGGKDADGIRIAGNVENDNFKSHNHIADSFDGNTGSSDTPHTHQYTDNVSTTAVTGSAVTGNVLDSGSARGLWRSGETGTTAGSSSTSHIHSMVHTHTIEATGGVETRPINIALYYLIKY